MTTITVTIGDGKCEHCGASLEADVKRLTPGIVDALRRMAGFSVDKNSRVIYKRNFKHILAGDSQGNNLTVLRKNALIAKVKKDGKPEPGAWLITARGWDFLAGRISIPAYVVTFRRKIIEHASEYINIRDLKGIEPYYTDISSIERVPVDHETVQEIASKVEKQEALL